MKARIAIFFRTLMFLAGCGLFILYAWYTSMHTQTPNTPLSALLFFIAIFLVLLSVGGARKKTPLHHHKQHDHERDHQ